MYKKYRVLWAENFYQGIVNNLEHQSAEKFNSLNISNSFSLYESLIRKLRDLPNVQFCSLKNLQMMRPKDNIIIALRYDVDINVTLGVKCARFLARYSIPSTFYILHTAPYYGYFKNNIFYRNPFMKDIIMNFIVTGCEIGLHIDPLSIYINYKVDGAQALKLELEWLRNIGVKVVGTASHNSAPVYGAENFEIFKGRSFQSRSYLRYKNMKIPLQILDERCLGLTYEANYPIPKRVADKNLLEEYIGLPIENAIFNQEWMKFYLNNNPYFERGYDYTFWLNGNNTWVISGHQNNKSLFLWNITTEEIFKFLYNKNDLLKGQRIVFVIHPCYFSKKE